MYIFDGKHEAQKRKEALKQMIKRMPQIHIFALVFQEDIASIKYTELKQKDAQEVGILYTYKHISITSPVEEILSIIEEQNKNDEVTGIIIQKPVKSLMPSQSWWSEIIMSIDRDKDVDGLRPDAKVMPATAKAIIDILAIACIQTERKLSDLSIVIMGRSEIVGKPVYHYLQKKVKDISLFGSKENPHVVSERLMSADVVICATGVSGLLTKDMFKDGVIVIDAGSPKPEVNPTGLESKTIFLSPVPGGVGPMTRVCLLENAVNLVQSFYY